ncbi:ATP-binding protein [Streptomyces acidicola]|uniref:ATP-binding protein n=1 Tax=Streptomyces acidicola TaxID=2596892 RepID=UPI003816A81B
MISLSRAPRLFRVAVAADPSCAGGVRRMVAAHLRLWRLPHLIDDVVPATDELFANAVRHASTGPSDTVAVSLEYSGDEVRVTLADSSPVPPRPRTPDAGAETGRGLAIVEALTDDWGTDPPAAGDIGKKVWFSIAVRGTT